jgi:hypothetical protein
VLKHVIKFVYELKSFCRTKRALQNKVSSKI